MFGILLSLVQLCHSPSVSELISEVRSFTRPSASLRNCFVGRSPKSVWTESKYSVSPNATCDIVMATAGITDLTSAMVATVRAQPQRLWLGVGPHRDPAQAQNVEELCVGGFGTLGERLD